MSTNSYRQALDAATREYQDLQGKRQEIDDRLAQLAQTIAMLNRLCGLESTVQWGLTDACRVVLKAARRDMTPTEVRDRLEAIGFPLTRYTNSLAAIHTVLKRLHDAAEVLFVERPGRRFACEWRPSVWSVVVSEQELMATLTPPTGVIPDAPRRTRGRK